MVLLFLYHLDSDDDEIDDDDLDLIQENTGIKIKKVNFNSFYIYLFQISRDTLLFDKFSIWFFCFIQPYVCGF